MNGLQIPDDACIVTNVIICTKTKRGDGTDGNPIRTIVEILTTDGKKIAEFDPVATTEKVVKTKK